MACRSHRGDGGFEGWQGLLLGRYQRRFGSARAIRLRSGRHQV